MASKLQALFKIHYKREPRGGLQACVEGCGLPFEGRAHSGLVDSRNTAAIVVQMIQQGFKFTRSTRGFAPDGQAWGVRKKASETEIRMPVQIASPRAAGKSLH